MDKNLNQKLSRSETLANKWKQKKLTDILILQDAMVKNNIDKDTIEKIINEKCNEVDEIYKQKVNKTVKKPEPKNVEHNKDIQLKKRRALKSLLRDKVELEKQNIDPEYIKNHIDRQYQKINQIYVLKGEANDDDVDFID